MKKTISILTVGLLALMFTAPAMAETLNVIHVNDTHSFLYGFGSKDEDMAPQKGGISRLATYIGMSEMYGENYGYMSSLNNSMISHLKIKALNLKNKYNLKSKDFILDIGSNDGTFLLFFNNKFKLFGCDPTIKKFSNLYRKDINQLPVFFSSKHFKESPAAL